MIVSDDVGSFPLPGGVSKESLRKIAEDIVLDNASDSEIELLSSHLFHGMDLKLSSGIMRPNYFQVHDMIDSFSGLIERHYEASEPWVVEEKYARIPEVLLLKEYAKGYYEKEGRALKLRVCLTGPLEFYLKRVGLQVEGDLLFNIARSFSRFLESSIMNKKYLKTLTVCVDEPSLGLNPGLVADREDLIRAWDRALKPARGLDVQAHLHSATSIDLILDSSIGIIGVESAEDPRNLGKIDPGDLEEYDKFLRVGVARTNIYSLMSESSLPDPWGDPAGAVSLLETKRLILKRLKKAYALFGERISYAGPDCGLGAWPDQDSAYILLKNTADAIDEFNRSG